MITTIDRKFGSPTIHTVESSIHSKKVRSQDPLQRVGGCGVGGFPSALYDRLPVHHGIRTSLWTNMT